MEQYCLLHLPESDLY